MKQRIVMKIEKIKESNPSIQAYNNFSKEAYTPSCKMLKNIISQGFSTHDYSPIMFSAILSSLNDNDWNILKDGMISTKTSQYVFKLNIAQYILFDKFSHIFKYFSFNEESFNALNGFFNVHGYETPNSDYNQKFMDAMKPFITNSQISHQIDNNERFYEFIIGIKQLSQLSKYTDIHELLQKDIPIFFPKNMSSEKVSCSSSCEMTIDPYSYLVATNYNHIGSLFFYNKNISDLKSPLALFINQYTHEHFAAKILSLHDYTTYEERETLLSRYLENILDNANFLHKITYSDSIFSSQFLDGWDKLDVSTDLKNRFFTEVLNTIPAKIVPEVFNEKSIKLFKFIKKNDDIDFFENFFQNNNIKNTSRNDFVVSLLCQGKYKHYSKDSPHKHDIIIYNNFEALPFLKKWMESFGEQFDSNREIFNFCLHSHSLPIVKDYLSLFSQDPLTLTELQQKIEKFYPQGVSVLIAPNEDGKYINSKGNFNMSLIDDFIMRLETPLNDKESAKVAKVKF